MKIVPKTAMQKKQNNERGKEQPTHGYTERFIE